MAKTVQVQIGAYRSVESVDWNAIPCDKDDFVILQVERGVEFGRVVSDMKTICDSKPGENTKWKILRKATEGDLKQIENNTMNAKDALSVCVRCITERKLDMKIVKSEYTFDSSKIIFFFTADGRVDFRSLVKDLAGVFRLWIELKQIGVRDKAKIIGGYGVCGRELCCSSYMKKFHPLSIKMAKEQRLPLNPSHISGVCGRIKCCMAYEFNVYKEYAKSLPHVGERINTDDGRGKVVNVDILKGLVMVELAEGKVIKKEYALR